LLFAGLLAVCVVASSVRAEDDKVTQIENLFREGVDLYQQGKYSESQRKLKKVLELDPRKELAARLVDEAGTKIMVKMMADVRMGTEPQFIWQLYKKYYISKLGDAKRMADMAARLVEPATTDDERAGLYREFAELGHYAMPVLAPYLKDAAHDDRRTYARIAIARMGTRAVLPVIELVRHPDELMRENAIYALTDITPLDPRALAALKARIDDPNETNPVKAIAAVAFKKVSGLAPEAGRTAAEYYYEKANRYYLDRAGVAEEAEDVDGMAWHLNDKGELVSVQYPLWAWNEQMAEQSVLDGLGVNAEYSAFFPLWGCIQAAQYTEVKDLLDIINEQPTKNSFSAEEKKEVENWDKKLVNSRRLIAGIGKEHCNQVLHKVLADVRRYPGNSRLSQVGACLARELAMLDPVGDLLTPPAEPALVVAVNGTVAAPVEPPPVVVSTSALVQGMDSPDFAIQYACALSLIQIDRFPMKWIGSEKVAAILGRGVSEDKNVHVLLVEEKDNAANAMRQKLSDAGFGVTIATSARNAVLLARSFPPKDLVIVSDSLRRDLTAEQLLEELRADVRTRYLPIGILHVQADRVYIQSRFGADVNMVEREAAGNDLKTAVTVIADKRAPESTSKRDARNIAIACATALSKLDLRDTHILYADALPHALAALVNRPEEVRVPAAIFLGHAEGGARKAEAIETLKRVFVDAGSSVLLRKEALRALGRINKDVLEEFLTSQTDADQEIKDVGAESFGQTSRKNADVINFLRANRIDKDAKEK
jgi:CheY-like chemotaxis protein